MGVLINSWRFQPVDLWLYVTTICARLWLRSCNEARGPMGSRHDWDPVA
jgi:hypothetical protein